MAPRLRLSDSLSDFKKIAGWVDMVKGSKRCEAFTELVECMAPPAILISLPKLEVLASNHPMMAKYGAHFTEAERVAFDSLPNASTAWLSLSTEGAVPLFHLVEEAKACFRMMRMDVDVAVVYEMFPLKPSSLVAPCEDCGRKAAPGVQPFHFSYMESVATGRRSHPHPELLVGVGLLAPGQRDLDWRSLIDRHDLPLYDTAMANAKAHGGSHELAYNVKTLSGLTIPVSDFFTLTPSHDGKWPVIVGTVMSRHPVDEDLRSLKRLELQGRLLGGMVHDFKNLLGGIQNIIEWSMTLAKDKPELADALGKTLNYTAQATKLITGTLRMGSSKREIKTELVNVASIVQGLEPLIRHSLPSNIDLELYLDAQTPRIYAQRDILKDIILNLCVNARDAMSKRGHRLVVAVFPRELSSAASGSQLFASITVTDDGCGMTKEQAAHLFEAFQSTKDHGVGLGLWMVGKTVKSLDGRISVVSEPGKGSSFDIMIPAAGDQAVEREIVDATQTITLNVSDMRKFREGPPKTILYVEDDPLIRSSVAAWLESFGFVIIESDNGTKALELFKRHSKVIDLVIQDFIIPGLRGDELLDGILKISPSVPVVVASANPDDEMVAALRARGAREFLPKPFLMDELLAILLKIFKV